MGNRLKRSSSSRKVRREPGTVRQAITALVSEGLLTKIQGKGTFKSGVALDRSTAVVKSFTDQLLLRGSCRGSAT